MTTLRTKVATSADKLFPPTYPVAQIFNFINEVARLSTPKTGEGDGAMKRSKNEVTMQETQDQLLESVGIPCPADPAYVRAMFLLTALLRLGRLYDAVHPQPTPEEMSSWNEDQLLAFNHIEYFANEERKKWLAKNPSPMDLHEKQKDQVVGDFQQLIEEFNAKGRTHTDRQLDNRMLDILAEMVKRSRSLKRQARRKARS
jgi:hypothetical protein